MPGNIFKKNMINNNDIDYINRLNNVEIIDKYGNTPLIYAASKGYIKIIEQLLRKGANINANNNYGNTALIIATQNNYINIVNLLVKRGANLDFQNNTGNTALIIATQNNYINIVNLLVESGANLDLKNNDGNTALIIASMYDSFDIVQKLVEGRAILDLQNNYGNTALMKAIEHDNINITYLLLTKGANIKITAKYGETTSNFIKNRIIKMDSSKYNKSDKKDENKIDEYRILLQKISGSNIQYENFLIELSNKLKPKTKSRLRNMFSVGRRYGGKKNNLKNHTLSELKSMCRENKLKNYSNLNKDDLVKMLKKGK